MQTRSKFLTAAAVAVLAPVAASYAQSSPSPAPTQLAAAQTGVVTPAPTAGNTLPQAPSALLAPQETGLTHAAGSGATFVAPGSTQGPGGYLVEKTTGSALPLSLDDAISLGLQRNYRLKYEHANQRAVRGYQGQIRNAVIPNLQFKAASTTQELNLAAMGFSPSKIGGLLSQFGITNIATIVKINTTSVQLSVDQQIFNMPDFELYRAIKPEFRAVDLNVADTNEQLVQAVVSAYLRVLADQANLNNTIAEEQAAKVVLDQATQRDEAGIAVKLDVLRAQVDYQQRQQTHLSAEAQLDKDGIQLNRVMGLPAGQQLDLIDQAPFSELADMDVDQAKQTAFAHRSDLLALQQSAQVAGHELKAIRYQRLPTVAVNGFYGVLGETTGLYHGVFTAQGSLRVPVFREAGQRGEQETAEAQLTQLRDQESNLRGVIDAQIRTSLLDINANSQLVKVAQSNVDLSQQELADARDRFGAGVSDSLEVVNAEAAVTSAQAQLVQALYQFNVSKVSLARSTGVLQGRYRAFLGM